MRKLRYAQALNEAIREEMAEDSTVCLIGEDIGTYGGVFKITRGLKDEFGASRVLDTPISEAGLAGMTIGASMIGIKPVLEIMYSDFLPLCLDALVNQASPARFIWAGQVTLPFVIRTQGGGGAGAGAQHSKSLEAFVTHIPGLKVVAPAFPDDAKSLLRASIQDPNPVIFLEHKLLYNSMGEIPDQPNAAAIGKARVVKKGKDVSIFATSHMVIKSLGAAKILEEKGINAEIVDLRTLRPLDTATVFESVRKTNRAVVVNEGWRFGGYGAELSASIAEECLYDLEAPVQRIGTYDRPIPYSQPLERAAIPNEPGIVLAAEKTLS